MHCSTGQGKMHSPLFSAAVQNRLRVGSLSLQLFLWRFALHTGVQWSTAMDCSTGQGKMPSPLFSAALPNKLTVGTLSLQLPLWRLALHTGVQ